MIRVEAIVLFEFPDSRDIAESIATAQKLMLDVPGADIRRIAGWPALAPLRPPRDDR